MPKLLLFTVAEKVVFDQTGKPSLIVLFDGVEIRPARGEEIPPNAVVPKEWSVFTQWQWLNGERGREFFQGVAVAYPDGRQFMRQITKADSSQERLNSIANFPGFPVGQAGAMKVDVWMEQDGKPVTEIFSLTLTVTVKPLRPEEVPPQQVSVKSI